ncbi:MAG: DUF4440 domain-containing protein [Cellvibrionaceae bacterium]
MNNKTSALNFPSLWGGYVNNGNLNGVLDLYNEDFVLTPTFSPTVVNTADGLQSYFDRLASREGLEVELHDNTIGCQNITEENYIVTGIYSFKFLVDGALLAFPSRFTFVINLSLDKPILHHHSSQIPRNLS